MIPRFVSTAGLDSFLVAVDALVAGEVWVREEKAATFKETMAKFDSLCPALVTCHRAFNRGLVPCQRLLDVLVLPYLKLAKHINQLSKEDDEMHRSRQMLSAALYDNWARSLICFVGSQANPMIPTQGHVLHPAKFRELLAEMLKAQIPEVIQQCLLTSLIDFRMLSKTRVLD